MIDLSNTKNAFEYKTDQELKQAYWLFKMVEKNWLVAIGGGLTKLAFNIGLPIKGMVKKTIFKQFCGGESINDCQTKIDLLDHYGIGTILDYSVEGKEEEKDFDSCAAETIRTIELSENNPKIPFTVFKVTGIARFGLLEKLNSKADLTNKEIAEYQRVTHRLHQICSTAFKKNVRIFIDAEESWIQDAIDQMATSMMAQFNKNEVIVYNTIQLYRKDRLAYLKSAFEQAQRAGYKLGVKLVRGAYMEKERDRAEEKGYPSPIQDTKADTDRDYDAALTFCAENIQHIAICAGSHNEKSALLLTQLMEKHQIDKNNPHIYFSQLLGMSDHISFNISKAGYNVSKYVPYGPVKEVMPYLIRRAQENTSISGQTGRELSLIMEEIKRRKA